jgi:hypothetical protein
LAIGIRQQRTQMQRRGVVFDVEMGDDGGVLPLRAPGYFGVPAGFDRPRQR